MNTPPRTIESAVPARKGKGCLFYGCLSTVLAVLISLVVIYYVASKAIRTAVETYGSTTPMASSAPPIGAPEYIELKKRMNAFRDAVLQGEPTEPLVLSSHDINAIIQYDAHFKGITGFVTFENGRVRANGSVPLDPFGYKGLYLNGTAKLKVGVTPDALDIRIEDLTIGDRAVPSEVLDQLRSQNVAESLREEPGMKEFWKHVDRIEIQGDAMTLYPVTAARP
ncbi:MAG: hypothetical protein J0M12_05285 [Deltaproteobacteria bacterium]|nr:hypothetical protein [Deltaproteobacteria bacterium]